MTPLERARDVMARYRAGDPDKTPPLARLIAEAIEVAEREARDKALQEFGRSGAKPTVEAVR